MIYRNSIPTTFVQCIIYMTEMKRTDSKEKNNNMLTLEKFEEASEIVKRVTRPDKAYLQRVSQ